MEQTLSRADKLTALCLEHGEPLSAREIARRVGISERQAVRCRQRLVELGVLICVERGAGRRAPRFQRPGGALHGERRGRDGILTWRKL